MFCINIKSGELDIFDGSPPCQGFSMVGKRSIDDERNQLFRQYVRLLKGLKPKAFVMENVSGMVKGKMKIIFAEVLRELKSCGYKVTARLLNAKYFGLAQSRQRMIFIGIRNDIAGEPIHPRPQKYPQTFYHACGDLCGNDDNDRFLPDIIKVIGKLQPDKWKSHEKIYTKIKGSKGGMISTCWASWNRTTGTLVKSEIGNTGIVHPDRERFISLAEAKRLSGFPDDYWFSGRTKGIERMGNCVSPPLMAAVSRTIYENYLR